MITTEKNQTLFNFAANPDKKTNALREPQPEPVRAGQAPHGKGRRRAGIGQHPGGRNSPFQNESMVRGADYAKF
ncbi:hypothetical protein [Burkholderia glumae]|uniref:Uncharacterized protein n=1 Tax=Burkholderia glumae TaxID=337 RepID=A0AAQ0BQF8_BURGL|nr:hypothetical protein [Burkholderia glumae]MCM2483715.1 hypothetical protein [Burkholderia glumae]MCM2509409.1 hypothetical protein [Burkholderia glumae]MCM2541486.1 hypothetical protein [Burkholderia glumae]MCM2545010.1 hypothetical protein [Burkholderia glumae]MCM2550820.1 hypothetical protein [Burkholderia glumae]